MTRNQRQDKPLVYTIRVGEVRNVAGASVKILKAEDGIARLSVMAIPRPASAPDACLVPVDESIQELLSNPFWRDVALEAMRADGLIQ